MSEQKIPAPWGDDFESWIEVRDYREITAAIETYAAALAGKARQEERERKLPDAETVNTWHESAAHAQSDKDFCAGWNACLAAIRAG